MSERERRRVRVGEIEEGDNYEERKREQERES